MTTEGTTGAVHEQEKLEAQADSEKKAKDTDENEEKVLIVCRQIF